MILVIVHLGKILVRILPWIHGCQDVVRIWQDLAMAAKMLVRGSTRVFILKFKFTFNFIFITSRERLKSALYPRLKNGKGDPSGFVELQLVAKHEKN